jgi:hypothetical protein
MFRIESVVGLTLPDEREDELLVAADDIRAGDVDQRELQLLATEKEEIGRPHDGE